MKQILMVCGALLLVALLLPLLSGKSRAVPGIPELQPRVQVGQAPQASTAPEEKEAPVSGSDGLTMIRVQTAGGVVTLRLSELLAGVVAGEMPAAFPPEALKAQAVAARTYILHEMSAGEKHPGADVCDDPACCAIYRPLSQTAEGWGERADEYVQKVESAVLETDGQIVVYDGEPILAVFHAVSSGKTERSADVWGTDLPYLQSVESPGEERSANFRSSVTMTVAECRAAILSVWPDAVLEGAPAKWFAEIVRTRSGAIKTLSVGGVPVTGGQARAAFGLRSAHFDVSADGDAVTFDVIGYGHGVGMSQTGAAAMAEGGADYKQILARYYPGTEIAHG